MPLQRFRRSLALRVTKQLVGREEHESEVVELRLEGDVLRLTVQAIKRLDEDQLSFELPGSQIVEQSLKSWPLTGSLSRKAKVVIAANAIPRSAQRMNLQQDLVELLIQPLWLARRASGIHDEIQCVEQVNL